MNIDRYKITVNRFTAEIDEPLDRELRSLVTCEVDIYDVSHPDNEDGTVNEVYKAKLVGTTIVKQGEKKPIIAKSKRSQSQKMRFSVERVADEVGVSGEELYIKMTNKIIAHPLEVWNLIKDL